MNRFLDLQEELRAYKKKQNAHHKNGKGTRYTYQKDNHVMKFEPMEINVSEARKTQILRRAGWKKANLIITVKDFKGEPLLGHRVFAESQAPKVVPQTEAVDIRGGSAIISDFWIKPKGTLRIMAVSTGKAGLVLSGVLHYTLPKNKTLSLDASQKPKVREIVATSVEEAAKKVGAKGSVGVDFEVFSAGGEVSGEDSRKKGTSVAQKYTIKMPTATLDIKVL